MGAPGPLADADHAVPGLHPGCGHIRQARPRMLISLGDAMLPVCMERSCPDRSARFAIRKTSQACALQGFDRHGAGGAQVVRGVPAAHAWRGERHPIAGAQRLHAGPHGRAAGRATDGALTARVCESHSTFLQGVHLSLRTAWRACLHFAMQCPARCQAVAALRLSALGKLQQAGSCCHQCWWPQGCIFAGLGARLSCQNALLCLLVTNLESGSIRLCTGKSSPNCCCQVCPTLLCEWFHGQPTGVYTSVTASCQ